MKISLLASPDSKFSMSQRELPEKLQAYMMNAYTGYVL